jgi:hypothetical protein
VCRESAGEEHPEGGLLDGSALISRPPGKRKQLRMKIYSRSELPWGSAWGVTLRNDEATKMHWLWVESATPSVDYAFYDAYRANSW